jgi:hypothetical protein
MDSGRRHWVPETGETAGGTSQAGRVSTLKNAASGSKIKRRYFIQRAAFELGSLK